MDKLYVAFAALLMNLGCLSVADADVTVVFTDEEVRIIADWYQDHSGAGRKPGKKSKGLPPGIAKNLKAGKALPPGIARNRLPDSLVHALPAPPSGYERVIVDGKVLLVEVATQVIHDILVDIIL